MTAVVLDTLCGLLAQIAPLRLAESWDNVGLLVGDRAARVDRVMTCLTVTPAVAEEALRREVDLIVTHHPLPFKPLAKITSDTSVGKLLLTLIAGGVALYSAHTAYDSAAGGINDMWAQRLALREVVPLVVLSEAEDPSVGSGRCGYLPSPMAAGDLAAAAAAAVCAQEFRTAGPAGPVQKVAIACGSGGSFLHAASARGCRALITGEATFHTCLEAESLGMALILLGHYASERFAMEQMAVLLGQRAQQAGIQVEVFTSAADLDPLRTQRTGSPKH